MPQDRSRVVWSEGMALDPHHLQQGDRHHRSVLHARLRALSPYGWGLTALTVDEERLANGEFALLRCAGVLPDGLPFDLPETGPLPEPRNVQDAFPATEEGLSVLLAVPAEQPLGANVRLEDGTSRDVRYVAEVVRVLDENTGQDEREVEVARPAFRLGFGGEALREFTALQVAEVVRSDSGLFALRETYIPTSLSLSASARLVQMARRLLELLVAKSTTLAERWHGVTQQRELSPADLTVHGLHLAASTYVPLLNHHHTHSEAHPEGLYTTMLALAGHLSAFTPGVAAAPRDFPVYDHANLSSCFNALDAILQALLGGAAPKANYVRIPLVLQRENLYTAAPDASLLEQAQLYLVTRSADLSETRIVEELPQVIRIASPETIDAVQKAAIRALPIEHTHRLPSGVPMDAQATYFQLRKVGPFWEAIQTSGGLAVFLPAEFNSLEMELIAA